MENTSSAEKLKGYISYPCCEKEKIMVWESCHGKVSSKCPRCGKFAIFDFDKMVSYPGHAAKGVVHKFKIKK